MPKAPEAAAGNQDSILHELPGLRLERAKKLMVFYSVWAGWRCAWFYRGGGGTETGNRD